MKEKNYPIVAVSKTEITTPVAVAENATTTQSRPEPLNMAKAREALTTIQRLASDAVGGNLDAWANYVRIRQIQALAEIALVTPARQCDVGTPAEQTARFAEFCKSHRHSDMPKCAGCPLEDIPDGTGCSQAWGQMPYVEKEGGNDDK